MQSFSSHLQISPAHGDTALTGFHLFEDQEDGKTGDPQSGLARILAGTDKHFCIIVADRG